ncbi:MAG: TrkH family potassium uptake protein [Muribaculaceae bacterium]|jgi:trk system potassium uptake protein|nr:TrkH family potassium uptake protein [Muribaculaceae bacterium]
MIRWAKINYLFVIRMLGWLLLIEAVFMLFPLIPCAIYHEPAAMRSMLYSILATAGTGVLFSLVKPKKQEIYRREGYLLTALVWIVFTLFGMLPYLFSGSLNTVADAFFETMSGFTTTGSTVMTNVESVPKGILFWRALTQWFGGMGIVVFTIAIHPALNVSGGLQIFNAEVTGITHDKLLPRISQTAKGLWLVYIVLSAAMTLLLWAGPMNLFDSLCQMMTAISTGGFSTKNTSIAYWNSYYTDIIIIIFMFLGGVNFSLLFSVSVGKPKSLLKNDTFRYYTAFTLTMCAICIAIVSIAGLYDNWADRIIKPAFICVSGITSTGFGLVDFQKWGPLGICMLFIMMYFGACGGSTAGGLKVDRMVFLFRNIKNEFYRLLHPNTITTVTVNSRVLTSEISAKIVVFIAIFTASVIIIGMILTATGVPVIDAMFSSLSALSNIGFGSGVTYSSYITLPSICKWALSYGMLIGRLEIFTVIILFTRRFWVQ